MPDQISGDGLSHDDVMRLCGDVVDSKVQAIIATGGTISDLEVALAWAAGEGDVMEEEGKPLEGAAAAIYDILTRDEELDERR